MLFEALTIAALAALLCAALLPRLVRRAAWLGLLDRPAGRKRHGVPVPCVGGLALSLGIVVTVLLALAMGVRADRDVLIWCAATVLMAAVGVVDDRIALGAKSKLLGQVLVGLGLCSVGLRIESLPLQGALAFELGSWAWPVTVLWFVVVTNAFNLIDGLDGLASGLAVIVLGAFAWLAWQSGAQLAFVVAIALIAMLLVFLRFNWFPARVYLGDSGSLLLGSFLAGTPLLLPSAGVGLGGWWLLVVAMGLPLLDLALCFVRRVLAGRSPLRADRGHLHHMLLDRGLRADRAALLLLGGTSLAVVLVLAGHEAYWPLRGALWVLALVALLLPYGVAYPERLAVLRRD